MQLQDFYDLPNGNLSFTRQQGSNFAKQVADDFNPLHDVDAKRFCIPGDLLFSVMLSRYGVSAHMECVFSGMVTEGVELLMPAPAEELQINDAQEREYLRIVRRGESSTNADMIANLCREYVQFSGHSFPHILVPLLAEHNVMIHPQRPMVMYQSMSIDLGSLQIEKPAVHSDHSELVIDGKRGVAELSFNFTDDGEVVGRGKKQILLSGLREYDEAQMADMVARYNERKKEFLQ